MIELYLSKVTENSESEQAGKYYARVSYKQTMGVQEMAHHMAEHNTMFSEGSITGILIDFVKCVREMVLMGNTVKIDNLAIFKATVEANALETLYDAEQDKVASASVGTLPEGAKTGAAVKVIKLLAQSTGDFTRDEPREPLVQKPQRAVVVGRTKTKTKTVAVVRMVEPQVAVTTPEATLAVTTEAVATWDRTSRWMKAAIEREQC